MGKTAKNLLVQGAIIGVSWLSYIIANNNAYFKHGGLVGYLAAGWTFFACELLYMGILCLLTGEAKHSRMWTVLGVISIIFAIITGYLACLEMFGH